MGRAPPCRPWHMRKSRPRLGRHWVPMAGAPCGWLPNSRHWVFLRPGSPIRGEASEQLRLQGLKSHRLFSSQKAFRIKECRVLKF